jgi:phosphatidylinositol alpha-1,6-mannosyltransferase
LNAGAVERRVVAFSAFRSNLRAAAIVQQLRRVGVRVDDGRRAERARARGSVLEVLTTLVPNCWRALTTDADVAVGFKPHPNVTLPLAICRWRGIATWIDVDDLDHSYRRGLAARAANAMQRPFPRRCDVVTYHHPLLRDYVVDHLGCDPARVVRLAQGVDTALFDDAYADAEPATVAFAGHLNAANDVDSILAAWRIVARPRPDARLLVIGAGPRERRLRRLATRLGVSRSVEFVTVAEHALVARHLRRAHIGVVFVPEGPFNEYRCSLKLREYFAAGLTVVCTDVGELAGFAALTHQSPPTIDAFARVLLQVLDRPDDGRAAVAQAYARDELDWEYVFGRAFSAVAANVGWAPADDAPAGACPEVTVAVSAPTRA